MIQPSTHAFYLLARDLSLREGLLDPEGLVVRPDCVQDLPRSILHASKEDIRTWFNITPSPVLLATMLLFIEDGSLVPEGRDPLMLDTSFVLERTEVGGFDRPAVPVVRFSLYTNGYIDTRMFRLDSDNMEPALMRALDLTGWVEVLTLAGKIALAPCAEEDVPC